MAPSDKGKVIKYDNFKSFEEFYPFYLSEHSNRTCRRLHVVGSTLSLIALFFIIRASAWHLVWTPLLIGYGCAWVGHFGFEKNKPASFKFPIYSFMGDWVMWSEVVRGKRAF